MSFYSALFPISYDLLKSTLPTSFTLTPEYLIRYWNLQYRNWGLKQSRKTGKEHQKPLIVNKGWCRHWKAKQKSSKLSDGLKTQENNSKMKKRWGLEEYSIELLWEAEIRGKSFQMKSRKQWSTILRIQHIWMIYWKHQQAG